MADQKRSIENGPNELKQLKEQPELREKLQQQLQKDLGCDCPLENWQEELPAILENMALQKTLSATLYRIDLAEREYTHSMNAENPWQQLAFSVLKREAHKVLLRQQFGRNNF